MRSHISDQQMYFTSSLFNNRYETIYQNLYKKTISIEIDLNRSSTEVEHNFSNNLFDNFSNASPNQKYYIL